MDQLKRQLVGNPTVIQRLKMDGYRYHYQMGDNIHEKTFYDLYAK